MFDFQFEPTHAEASRVRQEASRLLDAAGIPPATIADVELVLAELTSNAVEQEPNLPVRLEVAVADGAVHLTVANQSTGEPQVELAASPDGGADSDVLADRGRGLMIVRALTDELWVDRDTGWTSISCLLRFDQSAG